MTRSLNRVTVDLAALAHNFDVCRQQAGAVPVLAMVKADAYGHGMVECARVLAAAGAAAFGVAEVVEGIELRRSGIGQPIFIMAGVLAETVSDLVTHRLTPVLADGTVLVQLSAESLAQGTVTGIHLKLDAGMGRQGMLPSELPAVIRQTEALPGLRLEGILAHFPAADIEGSASTQQMLSVFHAAVADARKLLSKDVCLHVANSAGLFYVNGGIIDMVRPGIALYGYHPDGARGERMADHLRLRPVMRFATKILQVRRVPAGHGLGYGHIHTTSRPTVLAVLPVGYEDGYLRRLSNRAQVLVHGCRAPVVGRISMNLTLVDVTDIVGVSPGDEAVLLGSQAGEEITADEIAGWLDTISYEVLCLFGKLNERAFVR